MKSRLKNYTASLLLAAATAAMLAACGGGASNTASTPVTAPADAVQNVVTGSTVTLDGSTVSTADGAQTYNWTLESKPANSSATLSDPSVPNPTFTVDQSGTYIAKLVTGSGASTRVTIMGGVGNVAPVANAGVAQNVTTGTLITLDGSASSDANADPLTYRWWFISKPAGSTAALTAAVTAAPTFSADVAGTYVAQLIVNDGTENSKASTVTITATAGNAVPVANAGIEQNAIVGALVTLDGSASSDANADPLTYQWYWTYRPTGSAAALTGANTATPTFKADITGTYIARLVVNDGAVNSAAAAVIINVPTGNAAPVADAGAAQNVLTGTLVTLNGSASSDANADPLTYKWVWVYKPTGSLATLIAATTTAPTFSADLAGSYIARLIVNDGKVNSAAALVRITATTGTNAVPVANAGTTQTVQQNNVVTLNGSASSDANSDPITYKWTLISKPIASTAALAGKNTAAPTFTADMVGTYVASLVVNDGMVNSVASTVLINAVANAVPVANAGVAQSVSTGDTVTLDGSASSDADSDPLTYNWTLTTTPAGSSATLNNALSASPTFTADLAGTYIASLVVNDGKVNSVTATVTITATTPVSYPAGYVMQGGLVWMPNTYFDTWGIANTYCADFSVNGVTGWRLPRETELIELHASGALNGQGWTLSNTWSSLEFYLGAHLVIDLNFGALNVAPDTDGAYVSCVH